MFQEYPKSLYLRGWDDLSAHVIVQDGAAETEARKAGYRMLTDPPALAPDTDGDGAESKAELLAEADRLGVTVDRRWGVARLREALAEAAAP